MGHETKKMNQIRLKNNYNAFFYGDGVDIGCGRDILDKNIFTNISSVIPYDRPNGDANYCQNLADNSFDFVYSSHCLEHMQDPYIALKNWIRICKINGYIIVAVPHEVYYEKLIWPSRYNPEHTHSFRTEQHTSMPKSIFVKEWLKKFTNTKCISCELILENFNFENFWSDQTLSGATVQIEFVLKKIKD